MTILVQDSGGLVSLPAVVEVVVVQRPRITANPPVLPHPLLAPGSRFHTYVNVTGTDTARFPMLYRWERCWLAYCTSATPQNGPASSSASSIGSGDGRARASASGKGAGAAAGQVLSGVVPLPPQAKATAKAVGATREWGSTLPRHRRELVIEPVLHNNFLEGGSFEGDGRHYRVVVTNAAGSLRSDAVSFSVASGVPTWTVMNKNDNKRERVGLSVLAQTSGANPKIIIKWVSY